MTAAALGFYAASALALAGGLAAVLLRRSEHALAGFAIAAAAVLIPLIQLHASAVAGLVLLAAALALALLGGLARLAGPAPSLGRAPLAYWIPAGAGLLGFAWVVLATGSRQVVDLGDPLPRGQGFGDGERLALELADGFGVPAALIASLALCAVIAAVLGRLRETS